jgi:butyrate kinase
MPERFDYVQNHAEGIRAKNLILPRAAGPILDEISLRMGKDNRITIQKKMRKAIAEQLRLSEVQVASQITILVRKGFLEREERGVYMVNPYFCSKCNLNALKGLRGNWNKLLAENMDVRSITNDK